MPNQPAQRMTPERRGCNLEIRAASSLTLVVLPQRHEAMIHLAGWACVFVVWASSTA
jgi:hypothetical protein